MSNLVPTMGRFRLLLSYVILKHHIQHQGVQEENLPYPLSTYSSYPTNSVQSPIRLIASFARMQILFVACSIRFRVLSETCLFYIVSFVALLTTPPKLENSH